MNKQPETIRVFYYFPPGAEEQRAFFVQLGATILSLAIIGFLSWHTNEMALRGVMIGAALGVLFLQARSAWQLETKARRSQNAQIAVDENGLQITDAQRKTHQVSWNEIQKTEVRAGRFFLSWPDGELQFSMREIEAGMELVKLISARGQSTPPPVDKKNASNFIALEPR